MKLGAFYGKLMNCCGLSWYSRFFL